jgi:acyl-CoA synthetase (AMP-forming)/AMP-acid ligase II
MTTLANRLLRVHRDDPSRLAVRLLEQDRRYSLTYHDLLVGAERYVRAFERAQIARWRPLVILHPHGRALIEAFLGAVFYGAVPAILPYLTEKMSPERYRDSLQALLRVTRPSVVLTYTAFESEVRAARRESGWDAQVLTVEHIPDADPERVSELQANPASPDDLVLLQHSSGTTGLQKGVALTNRALLNQIDHYAQAIRMSAEDVIVSWLPLYHDMGLIAGFLMPLALGAVLVLMSPFDWVRSPGRLFRAVSDEDGTLSWLPNFAFNFCAQKVRAADLEGVDLSSWRAVVNCSEPVRFDSHQQFLGRFDPYGLRREALATSYAMAENVFAVTQSELSVAVPVDVIDRDSFLHEGIARPGDRDGSWKMLSSGRPIAGTEVKVIGKGGEQLSERRLGEIAIRSDCLFEGYYHREDLAEESFSDGWFLTGDLGYLADGELYVTGRRKDLIIVGGKNIYPQDLEVIAGDVEGVHPGRVAAFGVFRERLGTEEVVMVAESDFGDARARRELAEDVRLQVNRGSDVALGRIRIVDRGWLVKSSSGKIARAANREKYLHQFEGAVGSTEEDPLQGSS